ASKSENLPNKRATEPIATTSTNKKLHVRIVPSIENPSRCVIFDIVDRELEAGSVIKIGRYSERHTNSMNCMSFKSKVVSRCHCEVFVDEHDGKMYVRDTKSSSGTFLNHVRLSPAGNESKPVEIHDGDIIQLGVDFQGGREEMYRSVKMKFEFNRNSQTRHLSYNLNAFHNIRTLTTNQPEKEPEHKVEKQPMKSECDGLDECCICLYAMAPFQALFVSPCSHTYHFKCIRPLLQSYPGFQCPICRTYSDLEASVATEEDDEVIVPSTHSPPINESLPRVETVTRVTTHVDEESPITDTEMVNISPLLLPSSSSSSSPNQGHTLNNNDIILTEETHVTDEEPGMSNTTDEEIEDTMEITPEIVVPSNVIPRERRGPPVNRERRSSQFMEKLKMVFFEKRKSQQEQSPRRRSKKHHQRRPVSYPNHILHLQQDIPPLPTIPSSSSNMNNIPLNQTLSRQSTTNEERLTMMMVVDQ
ncbi:hypothetical protein CU098_002281, partial [Rhizopus stolonifer]